MEKVHELYFVANKSDSENFTQKNSLAKSLTAKNLKNYGEKSEDKKKTRKKI